MAFSVAVVVALSGFAAPARPATFTSALQAAINAINTGAMGCPPVPPNTSVKLGDVPGGYMGSTSADGSKITIDADNIEAFVPGLSADPETLAGVLAAVLAHECYHANEATNGTNPPVYNTPCGEITANYEVAGILCEWISAIDPSQRGNLCALYNKNADCYNNGCKDPGNGGASTFHAQNCQSAGDPPYPGDIPPCPACDQ